MRRYVTYLIIASTLIILLTSFSLFYFNDGLLVDSLGRLPAHLGAAEMGRKENIGHTSVKSKPQIDVEVQQSDKWLSADRHAKDEILSPQAVNAVKHHSSKNAMKGSMDSVVKPDKALRDKMDALIQKDRSVNGNTVLNGGISSNATNDMGHALHHNSKANPYQKMNEGLSMQRYVKVNHVNHLSSNRTYNTRRSQGIPLHSDSQLTKQSSYNNYLLSSPCSDLLCTSFLSERDLGNFTACKHRTEVAYSKKIAKIKKIQSVSATHLAARFSHGLLQASGECQFMNGSGRSPVGLVSFPGSGNTWVRGLLQKATGICTGAVYCDRMLRVGGFDGEGVQSGAVLVVKTHSITPLWTKIKGRLEFSAKGRPFFDSAVLVVRNPFHALVSEWNRELSTKYGLGQGNGTAHTNVYGREYFQTYSHWTKFVEEQVKHWKVHFDWLLKRPKDHNIILVRYEDLKQDLLREMERILTFLQFPYTYTALSAKLSQDFSLFHRSSKPKFDHFTSKQKELVNAVIKYVSQQLYDAFGTTFSIEEYIST